MIHFFSLGSFCLILFSASILVYNTKIELNQELKSCVEFSTEFNRKRRDQISKLISLNPKAKSLRQKRKTAEHIYKTAPPQAKPAALAALQSVKLAQKIFQTHQLKILNQIKLTSKRVKFMSKRKRYQIIKGPYSNMLKSTPKNSDSPDYKPVWGFPMQTMFAIQKKFLINTKLPMFFQKQLSTRKGEIQCGSNIIITQNEKLELRLIGGKSF